MADAVASSRAGDSPRLMLACEPSKHGALMQFMRTTAGRMGAVLDPWQGGRDIHAGPEAVRLLSREFGPLVVAAALSVWPSWKYVSAYFGDRGERL